MRDKSQETLIGTIRAHVTAWRKDQGWSRETVVQQIIEAHDRLEGPAVTGIVFDPTTRDLFERQKVNADRVFRWLDDEAKDNNLLPANFICSILAAMPLEVRLPCVADCLRPVGLVVASSDAADTVEFDHQLHVRDIVKESAEAALALMNLAPGASLAQLEQARKEVDDVHEVTSRTRRALVGAIARLRAGVSKVRHLSRRSAC